ncbi:MAG: hypothetical protein AAGA86_06480 [Bacteroidota bacterium]
MYIRLSFQDIKIQVGLILSGIMGLFVLSCSGDDTNPVEPPEEPTTEEFIRLTAVDPEANSITISNLGTTQVDISAYQLCLGPGQYNAIDNYTTITGVLSLAANAIVTIDLASGSENVTDLPDENGGLGLFANADDFNSTDPEVLRDYVQWGAADQNRVSQAVTAGRWDNALNFVSGFAPYTFSGTSAQVGASNWQTLNPADARLKTGFVLTARTPNGDIVAKYFDEMPSGTADLTDGQVFTAFTPRDILEGYLYTEGGTDGSEVVGRARVNGNGEIIKDGSLAVTGNVIRPVIVDATTGLYSTQATPAQIGVFNPITMQLEGQIPISDEELPGPQRMRNIFIRGDEVFTHVVSINRRDAPFTSAYLQSANYETGTYVATAEFPGLGINNLQSNPFSNIIDEEGNIFFLASGNPPAGTAGALLKIPTGSNEFDPDYRVDIVSQIAPLNRLLPVAFFFNYLGNDIGIATAITEIPQSVLDILASVGGNPANLSREQLAQIAVLFNTEETGRWVKINVETQEAENIVGLPAQGGFAPAFSVTINGEVYLSISSGMENAIYTYDPNTDAVEKVFDVVGGSVTGLVDLSW